MPPREAAGEFGASSPSLTWATLPVGVPNTFNSSYRPAREADGRRAPTPRSVASKRRSCSDLVRSTGAATGEGQAEEQPVIDRPAEAAGECHAQQRGDSQPADCTRQDSRLDGHKIGEREVQADGEEQQDDADLGLASA